MSIPEGPPASIPPISQLTAAVEKAMEADLSVPAIAKNRCGETSRELRRQLRQGQLIAAYGPRDVTGPSVAAGHIALLIDGDVYDFTARQFWPDSEYPIIEPLDQWAARFTGQNLNARIDPPGLVVTWPGCKPIVPHPAEATR